MKNNKTIKQNKRAKNMINLWNDLSKSIYMNKKLYLQEETVKQYEQNWCKNGD